MSIPEKSIINWSYEIPTFRQIKGKKVWVQNFGDSGEGEIDIISDKETYDCSFTKYFYRYLWMDEH